MHSKSSIYVFSTLDDDKDGIDKIGKIHRIKLDDEFVNGEMIDTKEFENSLVIFTKYLIQSTKESSLPSLLPFILDFQNNWGSK